MEPVHVGEAGEPALVEGVKGEWRVDPGRLVGNVDATADRKASVLRVVGC